MYIRKLLKKQGFTLVEMIVVVAIIAIMLGIVIPLFRTEDSHVQAAKEKARAFYSNVQELMIDEKLAGTKLPGAGTGNSNIVYVKLEIPSDSTVCDADIYLLEKAASINSANIIAECRSAADIDDSENIYHVQTGWNENKEWNEFAFSLYKILRITEIDKNYVDSDKQTAYFYAEVDSKYRVVTAYYSMGDASKAVGQEFVEEGRVGSDKILTGAYPFDKCTVTSPKQKLLG